MATVTWNVNKDARIAVSGSYEAGAGKSDQNPFGYYSGYVYRALLGFSYSFSGMVTITSAVLHVKTDGTGGYVESGSNASCYVYRITSSWSEGTAVSLTSSNAVTWANQPSVTSTNRASFNITNSNDTWDSQDITGIIQDAFAAGTFYGLELRSQNEGDASYTHEIVSREQSTSNDPYIVVTYTTNTAPNAPTSPSPTADAILNTLSPTFTATFSDPDVGDLMAQAQVLVYADNGTTLIWDSGAFAATGSGFSKAYTGPALTGNTFYKWQGRTADDDGAWGAYTALQRFKVNSVPNAPSISLAQSPTSDVTTLTPTFNVTHSDPDASDSQLLGYRIILETSGGSAVWDSGDVSTTATTTKSVTYGGSPALSWQSSYRWRARTQDSNGAWGAYSGNATFTTHTTGVPIGLDPTGGEIASSITPTFVGSRATASDVLTSAQIKVFQSDGTTLVWDSGTFTTGVTSTGFSKIYAGTALSSATTYKWQALVTSSVGGTSAWSALQTFVTPDTNTPSGTAPVGSSVTPVTNLQFTFTRTASFTYHQLYVYQSDGTTQVTSDSQGPYTAATSKTFTYTGTLSWNTQYKWKVRVSSDGSNWSSYTGLIAFTTDSAGVPTLNQPSTDAWLGAPEVVDNYDTTTNVTNGTSAATSIDTASADKQTGRGSLKIALTSLTAAATSETYRTVTKNLSKYGGQTPFKIWLRASTLTNLSTVRVRFTFATVSDYAEYTITPSSTSWEQKTVTKGSPAATGGTVNWSNITRIGIRVTAGASAYSGNINVDDLQADATAPSFDGTTYNSEVISTYRIRVYSDSGGTNLVWDSGDTAGSSTTFSKLYTGTTLTKGTTYYWQARYIKSTGPTGNYSALLPFVINSDPNAPSDMTPAAGAVVADSTTPTYSSTFSDSDKTSRGDAPTMYEVEVYRNSDSTLCHSLLKDASLIGGTNTVKSNDAGILVTTGAASPMAYETEYKYRSRYRDSMGAAGVWSSYVVIKPSQSPTATITSPSHLGTVTSPAFNITWSQSSPGSKGQNSYQLKVVRVADAVTLLDTGRVFTSATSFAFPTGYLVNSTSYDVYLKTWDTDSLESAYDVNRFTTSWTAPDPIVDFLGADEPSISAAVLTWVPSNLASSDFRKYTIYRKLVSESSWTKLVDITNQQTSEYNDYLAANTVSYDYKITQFKIVPGDVDLESGDSDIPTVTLDSDSWVVIGADRSESHIFELPVMSAPFAEPVQQEIFEPLGTSRKVIIRGKELGAEGTMQVRWKDSERDVAKAQVNYIKTTAGPHVLKSPFGDIWFVEFSGPSKDYMGGGHMNVTLVWTEVE